MVVSGTIWTLILGLVTLIEGQVLTPPYFNLAEGRRITATATCGEGVEEPELYCKLVGANSDKPSHFNVIQGQLCEYCDPEDRLKKHPPELAIDGSERWWQSPPLSRGMDYNEVNLTVDLGQLFQVAYVVIKMANSPRPGVWVLERSVDNGRTYTPWQYFADSQGDCERFFGEETLKSIENDDDVICTTRFSKVVPLEGGEIFVSLLNNRPSAKNFFNSTTLQEFTRATNVRLRLMRTKTLLGHLMSVARQDPTVTRRYFYSIKDISIGGRCVCNGHASVCDITDPDDKYQLQCRCQHNTCGSQCEECCPGFIQKKWRPASNFENFVCEPCNCFGHTNECIYDENVDMERLSLDIHMSYLGGGVCQNCRHHTEGINCNKCVPGYYRPHGKRLNDTDVCQPCKCTGQFYTGNCFEGDGLCECRKEFQPPFCDACNDGYYDFPNCKPCDCHKDGTIGGVCEVGGRQCPCKENYMTLTCSKCAPGYYNFSQCLPCDCVQQGSLDNVCNPASGQCRCQNNYGGLKCDRCEHGYFDYGNGCQFCNCDARGTVEDICDKETGQCLCKEGYSGERCDNNAPGFWGYPLVQICGCHAKGSSSTVCDASGKCACLNGYAGRACSQCSPGFYNFPECEPCNCDHAGSVGISCDSDGRCQCKYNFDGIHCDKCRENFYNFPLCEECNCHPGGVLETFAGCGNAPIGELCECKERVSGRICNKCKPLFWNLQQSNKYGCEKCGCHTPGTVGALATCDMVSGQCACKTTVTSRRCDQCKDGTYNLMEDNLFGCSDCQCNIGGSNSNVCDKVTGQCSCHHRIQGQRCDEPMQAHYFPTLYQHKYEVEDGRTPQNTPVRFGYDERIFPGYSWRGYAVYSELQKETIHDVYISKPSLYRLIFYYMNPSNQVIKGKVVITPENPLDDQQEIEVNFQPTVGPQLMTLSTANGFPLPFVMNPGTWIMSIQNKQSLYLDYMVLLPLAYYEATILTERATSPSRINEDGSEASLHFAYPDISSYDTVYGSAGFLDFNGTRSTVELFEDYNVLRELDSPPMAWFGANSDRIKFDVRLRRPGKYVLLINYYTPEGAKASSVAVTSLTQSGRQKGRAIFYDCTYTWICRQVVADLQGEIAVFDYDSNFVTIIVKIRGDTGQDITLHSITAVPVEEWHMDFVAPSPVCTTIDGECLQSSYPLPKETTKVEFESNLEGKRASVIPRGVDNSTTLVYLNESDPMVDITGKLRYAGRYLFVVHYFQPDHPRFDMDVLIQNGQFYEAILPLKHCPNVHGCRSIVTHLDNSGNVFDILENFVLTLKQNNGKGVWLDYVLVVPEQSFTRDVLRELPIDKTAEFIEKCGDNHFNIDPQDTGFCREAAFALTADYNNGALSCHCNFKGSVSFECQVFGGQCPCKPNVIGRECNQCKTGYFGFPNCRPCDCPSTALCDPLNGECICPPRVVGERCERCALHTYGFDPIIGCEECRCNEIGVLNGELQCDLLTGQCQCKDNVIGRRCERCAAGYWSFPFCQLCNCDLRGTEPEICSQSDATCFCKPNTEGQSCELCVRGTYNLQETNPDGCTNCFCFGKSQICSHSNLFWNKLPFAQGWKAVHLVIMETKPVPKETSVFPEEYTNLILMNLTTFYDPKENGYVFLAVPDDYTGNRLKSYGGFISFNLLTITDEQGKDLSGVGDVILYGGNITALYFHDQLQHSAMNTIRIELSERNFRNVDGISLRREEFMTMLHKLEGIYIRVQFGTYSTEARLTAFEMDTATLDYQSDGLPAFSVEQCQCPPNYSGSSCEECSPGFYRTSAGPYGGYCIPCRCNNHASTCDPVTGECISCRDNTVGFNCEMCAPGYFGDAQKGTPFDCLICSCPLPSKTNNFARRCELTQSDEIECECQEGYMGRRCDTCSPGYYGQPTVIGEYCKPCECNNNIDASSPYACDDISGLCLSCLNNTYGDHCERCAPGFFGDAVLLKNCQSCSCDECGTRECQHYTGVCECHENVIGDKCDRCAPEFWGFASCQGCHPCNCHEASESRQCDEETGQCKCRPGVTGQRCARCKPGYWNYSEYGCIECTCRAGFSIGVGCDPKTGQCSCLPGVIGDNCEGCPHRWVLIEGVGCRECDDCVHALLDTTDALSQRIFPIIQEYESAAQSFFLHQRLQVINDSIEDLRANVDVFDMSSEELEPVQNTIEDLYNEALLLSTKGKSLNGRATNSASEGLAVREQAREVIDSIYAGADLANDVITEINSLVIGLETGTGAKIELAIREAEKVVEGMKAIDFSEKNDQARLDYEVAQEFLERIQNLSSSGIMNQERVNDAVERLKDLKKKMDEMEKRIMDANDQVYSLSVMNRKSRVYGLEKLVKKHKEIGELGRVTQDRMNDAENYTALATMKLKDAEEDYLKIDSEFESLQEANIRLNDSVNSIYYQLIEATNPAYDSIRHSQHLYNTAQQLDNLLSDTRQVTENALRAANAYDNIVSSINDALEAALEARNASFMAVDLSSGVSEDAATSVQASEDKYRTAGYKISQVESILIPQLTQSQKDVKQLEEFNDRITMENDNNNRKLDSFETSSLEEASRRLQQEAETVNEEAEETDMKVATQHENLHIHAETARTLSKNIEDAKRDTKLAQNQVKNVQEILPGAQQITRDLLSKKGKIQDELQDVGDRLERLRRTITKTREKTNKIKVGIDFEQGSVLELKNPEDISDTATATELSIFIRTSDRSGLPLFFGTPVGGSNQLPRTKTDDFMAIEIDEGYVRLTTALGEEAHSIVNNAYVADNNWHKIHVKRVGKVVRLSVHSEDKGIVTVEKVLPGTYSILNLGPKVSKLYVGGIPAGVEVHPSLMSTYYTGQMEDLWINKRPIGLWNFVSRGATDFPLKGAKERLVLKESKATSHELRFDGSGYVTVDTKGHETSPELSAVISFKTFAEDGLLYLLKNGQDEFVSIEMRGGRILYQHKLEAGIAVLKSNGIYNDNNWHTIEATRVRGNAVIKVDTTDFQQARSSSSGRDFSNIPDVMYLGGYPGEHTLKEVTNEDFRGCIKDVRITEVTVDFSRSRESIGTVPGCVEEPVSLVSFHRQNPGYVKLGSPEGSGLQLVLKFKTDSPNGLLFYTETSNREIYLSLSLSDGSLVLRSAPGGEIASGSYTKYMDSEWHIVIATRENNELRLDIDDFEKLSVDVVQESVPFDGPVYFGGLPEYKSISAAAAAADDNFIGCVGDVTLNGRIIDFALAAKNDRPGAMLETCSLDKEYTSYTYAPDPVAGPAYPIDVRPITQGPYYFVTDEAEEDSVSQRFDSVYTLFTEEEYLTSEATPKPLDTCALPAIPEEDLDVTTANGLRFGSKRDSRIEYNELPESIRNDFMFSVEFRTESKDGIIFYAASISHRDFVTIYMNDGKIVFSFNTGTQPVIMRSTARYNDKTWHKLVAQRAGDLGRLEIDGYIVARGTLSGNAKHIDQQAPYYFGGLDNDIIELASDNTQQTFLSFNGCLRGFRMNNEIIGGKRRVIAVSACSYKVEPGVFFGEGKLSHAVARLKFQVGLMFEMYLEIKPRKNSGVIMSVHGRRDFILLQLRDGMVELKVDNGKGIISNYFNLSNPYQICDGQWHSVQVLKNKHLIVLTVDGISATPALGPLGSSSADTNKPLFLGSQPRLQNRRGNAVSEKFVGCMRNVSINKEKLDLSYILFVGEVNAGVCPLI